MMIRLLDKKDILIRHEGNVLYLHESEFLPLRTAVAV